MTPATAAAARELVEALDHFLEADARRRKARATLPLERQLQAAVATAFRRQGTAFLRRLATIRGRFVAAESRLSARKVAALEAIREEDWLPLWDETVADTLELLEVPLTRLAQQALDAGARAAIADLSLRSSFDLKNPRAVAYLEAHPPVRVAGINAATRDEIGRILRDGVANGKSYSAIAREIRTQFTQFAVGSPLEHIRSRADLASVTEIGDAYEAGNRIVADGLATAGLEMEKSWLDVGDRRVDPDCVSNAAEGWIPIDAAFSSGHQQPTAHPGCRCTTLYRRKPS